MTNILITGASGFIGGHLAAALLNQGHRVVSIKHDENPINTPRLLGVDDKIVWCRGSITNFETVLRVMADYEIEQVYHLAALPIVRIAGKNPIPVFKTNIMGSINVFQAAKEMDAKVLYMASDKVYGDAGIVPYKEDMRLFGYGVYEASKVCGDHLARCYHYEFGLKMIIARSSNIYGPADINSRIIPNTIKNLLKGKKAIFYKDIGYVREYTYIDDAVNALMLLMDHLLPTWDAIYTSTTGMNPNDQRHRSTVATNRVYNIGSGDGLTQLELLKTICRIMGKDDFIETLEPKSYMKIEIPYQRLDASKLRKHGWKPNNTLKRGLTKTVDWWKVHPELWGR